MDHALKKQILFELNFLLEGVGPEAQIRPMYQHEQFCKKNPGNPECRTIFDDFAEVYKNFKNSTPQERAEALKSFNESVYWTLENDPVAAVTFMLDVLSIPDPTGFADITQSIILFSQGKVGSGALCLVFGGIQLYFSSAAVATAGVTTGLAVAAKAEIRALKLGIKEGKNVVKIIDYLVDSRMSTVINNLKRSRVSAFRLSGERLDIIRNNAIQLKNSGVPIKDGIEGKRQLESVLGGNIKDYNSAISDAKREEYSRILTSNEPVSTTMRIGQGLSLATSYASLADTELLDQKRADESFKVFCKNPADNYFCSLIKINPKTRQIEKKYLFSDFKDGEKRPFKETIYFSPIFEYYKKSYPGQNDEQIYKKIEEDLDKWLDMRAIPAWVSYHQEKGLIDMSQTAEEKKKLDAEKKRKQEQTKEKERLEKLSNPNWWQQSGNVDFRLPSRTNVLSSPPPPPPPAGADSDVPSNRSKSSSKRTTR